MPTSNSYRDKADLLRDGGRPAKKKSWGPCFTIVCEDGNRFNIHIFSDTEPTPGQTRATAEETVLRYMDAYRKPCHWESYKSEPEFAGPYRGNEALAEAKRRILEDPNDSAGKRFLLENKKLGDAMAVPTEPKRKEYADRKMLDRLREEPAPVAGPVPFDLNDPETPLNAEGD